MQHIFWKCSKSIVPATQNDFWRVLKHDGMPRSATPATQNDMTTSSDTSKISRFCDFSHRHGNFAPTTVADGRLRTVEDGCGCQKQGHANTGQPPDPQMQNENPSLRIRENREWFTIVFDLWITVLQHTYWISRQAQMVSESRCLIFEPTYWQRITGKNKRSLWWVNLLLKLLIIARHLTYFDFFSKWGPLTRGCAAFKIFGR